MELALALGLLYSVDLFIAQVDPLGRSELFKLRNHDAPLAVSS